MWLDRPGYAVCRGNRDALARIRWQHQLDTKRLIVGSAMRTKQTRNRRSAVAEPLVCSIVHPLQLIELRFVARPSGELLAEHAIEGAPRSNCGIARIVLRDKAPESDRAARDPADQRAVGIFHAVFVVTVTQDLQHDCFSYELHIRCRRAAWTRARGAETKKNRPICRGAQMGR